MQFIRGVMLEGISCAGKTSTFNALKKAHTQSADCERNIIALGEHYSQILNKIDSKLIRMEYCDHLKLLNERLLMLEQLNSWACSLGNARRESRGLFVILERFYLNHICAFEKTHASIEERCNNINLKCILLTISPEKIMKRIQLRDEQMKIIRPITEIQKQAFDYITEQENLISCVNNISIPTLIVNTDSMDWDAVAEEIISFCT